MEMRDIQFTKPNFGNSPAKFFLEVRDELKKVTWPGRSAVVKMTLIVIGVTVAVSAYLGGLDFIFTKIFEIILSK